MKSDSETGQGAVEMALVMPLVFTLLVVCLELGFAFYGYVTVVWAAREGARAGAIYLYQRQCSQSFNDQNRESGSGDCPNLYGDNIRDSVARSMGVLPNFDKVTGITISYSHIPTDAMPFPPLTRSGDLVSVETTYVYHFITPVFAGRTISLKGRAAAQIEP